MINALSKLNLLIYLLHFKNWEFLKCVRPLRGEKSDFRSRFLYTHPNFSVGMAIVFLWIFPLFAFAADVPLPDSGQERRAQELFKEIRCMVCQGQAISDSNAEVAGDIRRNIRQQITSGMSEEKIKSELAQRYGDVILMNPPFKTSTVLLWLGPWVVLLIGGGAAFFYFHGAKPKKRL